MHRNEVCDTSCINTWCGGGGGSHTSPRPMGHLSALDGPHEMARILAVAAKLPARE
jgi:hypothetical protein